MMCPKIIAVEPLEDYKIKLNYTIKIVYTNQIHLTNQRRTSLAVKQTRRFKIALRAERVHHLAHGIV